MTSIDIGSRAHIGWLIAPARTMPTLPAHPVSARFPAWIAPYEVIFVTRSMKLCMSPCMSPTSRCRSAGGSWDTWASQALNASYKPCTGSGSKRL